MELRKTQRGDGGRKGKIIIPKGMAKQAKTLSMPDWWKTFF